MLSALGHDDEMLAGVPVTGVGAPWRAPRYGLGLMIDDRADGMLVGHGGDGPGYQSLAIVDPAANASVRVIARTGGAPIDLAAALVAALENPRADGRLPAARPTLTGSLSAS